MISLVIAAPGSGSGKTTVTLGLMAALIRRGLSVAPFKVGPDFIDPGYHRLVTGRPSVNLDGWMCAESFVRETFARHASGADVAVVEGVMGLFDGASGSSDAGSTAQIARIIGAPVILVVDAGRQARSAAALVKGFAGFDPDLHLAGVIFNNVGSDNHARILREAVASLPETIPVFGCIPRDDQVKIPSRHLGLVTAEDNPLSPGFLSHLAEVMDRCLDLDGMLCFDSARFDSAQRPPGSPQHAQDSPESPGSPQHVPDSPQHAPGSAQCPRRSLSGVEGSRRRTPVRIAVARDAAFCFVYEDNLRLLREAGAEIVPFSPLADGVLPDGVSGLYLPGGYPELFADTLAANEAMKEAIRSAVEAGMPLYAECGGFVYLTDGLVDNDPLSQRERVAHPSPYPSPEGRGYRVLSPSGGEIERGIGRVRGYDFVGIFPVTARMLPRRKALGYREVELTTDSLLGPAGTAARGHEFHYSEIDGMPAGVERLYRVRRQGVDLGTEGYRYRNCLASYVHLHFGSNPALAPSFVAACREFRDSRINPSQE